MANVAAVAVEVTADTSKLTQGLQAASDQTDQSSKAFSGLAGAVGKLAAIGAVAATGFAAFKVGILDSISAAQDDENVQAQLTTTLANLGTSTDVTAQFVNDLATQFSQITPNSKAAVVGVGQFLEQTNSLSQMSLRTATQDVLDLSSSMGISLTTASKQVAKELEHPEKAFALLSKQGVVLDAATQKSIKSLVKHGDVADAQSIILQKLNEKFGGAANAAGNTLSGKLEILHNRFTELQVKVGNAIIPVLSQLAQAVMPIVDALMNGMGPAIDMVMGILQGQLLPIITNLIIPNVAKLAAFVSANLVPAFMQFAENAGKTLLPMVMKFGQFVATSLLPIIMKLADFIIHGILPILIKWWTFLATKILPIVVDLAKHLISTLMPPLERLFTVITTKLVPALQKIWDKISPILIPVFQAIAGIMTNVVGPALGFILDVIGKVIDIISGLIDWIGKGIDWFSKLGDAITGAFKNVANIGNSLHNIPLIGGLIPHFAGGTNYAPGGMALVGEQGPEMVYLPRGSGVATASQTAGMRGGHGGGGSAPTYLVLDGQIIGQALWPHLYSAAMGAAGGH